MKKITTLLLVAIVSFAAQAQSWNLTGNTGTNPSSDFIGTTDSQPLIFKTNNVEWMKLTPKGRIIFQETDWQGPVWGKNLFLGGGNDNITGEYNTTFGLGTLTSNLVGSGNIAVGHNSLSIMTSGESNVSIGTNAMVFASSGDLNVAVGTKAMEGKGKYVENVAVGFAALGRSNGEENDAVSFNTGLGSRSLAYLKNGQNNIAIGYNTIKPLITGNGNIAIGNHAGFLLTNASGNILIGDGVNVTTPTSNNELNIGNWIVGNNGTIGIGQFTSQLPANGIAQDGEKYKLFVKDGIKTEKVKVDISSANGWADYVFDKTYKLMPLNDLEKFISKNGHLPEVPTTDEAIKNGIELKEMNILLLKKIEELTLYVIEQQKRIEALESKSNKADK